MRNKTKNMAKIKPRSKLNRQSQKIKKKVIVKPKKQEVLVVAQEIKFARLLSGNEKKSRDRVLKTLKKWLVSCFQKGHEFKEDDFIRVWKGLFYAVWMSDKPLIQEELCENIAAILDQFPAEQINYAVMMVKAGFKVLATEWYGIDHHRMDKFLMLVRRYLRGSLRCLHRCDWDLEACRKYSNMLSGPDGVLAPKTPHYARNATSMIMHLIDCYLEELAKVSSGSIPDSSIVELLRPFATYMCAGAAPPLVTASRRLLTALLRQSGPGARYEHAAAAWRMMGCPRGGPEALELELEDDDNDQTSDDEQDDEDDGEKPLDPRAGRVDVELPNLPVPARALAALLKDLLANASSKAHRRTKICLERFEKLANEEYPLPVEEVYGEDEKPATWRPQKAAKQLKITETRLVEQADELALRGLSRKHRKRLLAKSRAGISIIEDVAKLKAGDETKNLGGDWTVESTEIKQNGDISNKENVQKRAKKRIQKDTQKDSTKKRKMDSNDNAKKIKAEKKKNDRKINSIVNKRDNKLKKIKNSLALADSIKNFFDNRAGANGNCDTEETAAVKNKNVNTVIVKNEQENVKVHEKPVKTLEKVDETTTTRKTTKMVGNKNKLVENKNKMVENRKKMVENVVKTLVDKRKVNVAKNPTVVAKKVKNFQKQTASDKKQDLQKIMALGTPKRVKFVLKNNSAQLPAEYARAVRSRPAVPYDARKLPTKGNLKPSAPSARNPFTRNKK
ncbi:ribosomal RNA processing protein 1 homolog [Amyelois transitella]|uniref:ribosomal RNA processing protein 1 homolog n=1 Tax=Amyelois transitella TaxID=680683 RepID=UPI0029906726|nr:ribosomal RNA processing protein 1 homolog [Amyelois transitella]